MNLISAGVAETVRAVRRRGGFARLDHLGIVSVTGPDAPMFLQNQTTNDVAALSPGTGQSSALLDRKAHIQAYFSLYRISENTFWLITEKSQVQALTARLEQYHFTEAVEIEDITADWAVWTLQGQSAGLVLARALQTGPTLMAEYNIAEARLQAFSDMTYLARQSLTGELGYLFFLPDAQADAMAHVLSELSRQEGLQEITPESLEVLRVEAGIPRLGPDMDDSLMLPQTGLEQVAVSYSKGCYQGQEVVAKLRAYGGLQKALVGLVFEGLEGAEPLPAFNTECLIDGQSVGAIKSAVFSPTLNAPIALAYLNRDARTPGNTLQISLNGRLVKATVTLLPFYQPPSATELARNKYETALSHFAQDKEAEAVNLLREAIALDPGFADAYESLGVILSRHGELDEAITLMQKLAELSPEDVMPHTNLSIFYMKKGLKEEAETEKAIATTLSFKKALAQKQQQQSQEEAAAQKRKALEEKLGMFREVLELDPEDALAHYGLGNILLGLEQAEAAIPHLEKAIEYNPKHTVAYLALGKALEQAGQDDRARQAYADGIETAAKRGDLMPLQEMQQRLSQLG